MSLPIYWGNPIIDRDFNTQSFIHVRSTDDFDRAIEQIIRLDTDDDAYLAMLREPWFHNNTPNVYMQKERILAQFDKIFAAEITPVGTTPRERYRAVRRRLRHTAGRIFNRV
jgi:hypothetical protein